jgi:hypothetical protein
MMRSLSLLAFLSLSAIQLFAQKASDYRCVIFNEKMQRINISDSTLNLELLLKAGGLNFYLSDKKDPKAKVSIQEMTVTLLTLGSKFSDYTFSGNKVISTDELMNEIKSARPGDRIYVDHLVFKTASGKVMTFNKGYIFILK